MSTATWGFFYKPMPEFNMEPTAKLSKSGIKVYNFLLSKLDGKKRNRWTIATCDAEISDTFGLSERATRKARREVINAGLFKQQFAKAKNGARMVGHFVFQLVIPGKEEAEKRHAKGQEKGTKRAISDEPKTPRTRTATDVSTDPHRDGIDVSYKHKNHHPTSYTGITIQKEQHPSQVLDEGFDMIDKKDDFLPDVPDSESLTVKKPDNPEEADSPINPSSPKPQKETNNGSNGEKPEKKDAPHTRRTPQGMNERQILAVRKARADNPVFRPDTIARRTYIDVDTVREIFGVIDERDAKGFDWLKLKHEVEGGIQADVSVSKAKKFVDWLRG